MDAVDLAEGVVALVGAVVSVVAVAVLEAVAPRAGGEHGFQTNFQPHDDG